MQRRRMDSKQRDVELVDQSTGRRSFAARHTLNGHANARASCRPIHTLWRKVHRQSQQSSAVRKAVAQCTLFAPKRDPVEVRVLNRKGNRLDTARSVQSNDADPEQYLPTGER